MSAQDNLSPKQFVTRMRPSDLLQYADQAKREGSGQDHIDDLGRKIAAKGYSIRKHGGMSGDTHSYPPSAPITLLHYPDGDKHLWNGNHRVLAMNDVGYDTPVPVLNKRY